MEAQEIFEKLEEINSRLQAFEFYTASDLWADEYIPKQMLSFINRSDEWIISQAEN